MSDTALALLREAVDRGWVSPHVRTNSPADPWLAWLMRTHRLFAREATRPDIDAAARLRDLGFPDNDDDRSRVGESVIGRKRAGHESKPAGLSQ